MKLLYSPPGTKSRNFVRRGVFASPSATKEERRTSPKSARNHQEITMRNPLAKWGRNVYNSDRRKKCVENFKRQTFLKTKIRERRQLWESRTEPFREITDEKMDCIFDGVCHAAHNEHCGFADIATGVVSEEKPGWPNEFGFGGQDLRSCARRRSSATTWKRTTRIDLAAGR